MRLSLYIVHDLKSHVLRRWQSIHTEIIVPGELALSCNVATDRLVY
jgi:hypothetical protein